MSNQDSSNQNTRKNSHTTKQQTNQQRLMRIKKSKNIRKQKVLQKRIQNIQMQALSKQQPTRQQRKEIQKQKNRMAAQLSRDRQKKYVEDLQNKIIHLQKCMESQLCRKCKTSISDQSSTQDQHFQYQSNQVSSQQPNQNYNTKIDILNQQPQIQEPFFERVDSRSDFQWGNVGRYFCLSLLIISVCLLSSSIQISQQSSNFFNRPVARILTQEPICTPQTNTSEIILPSALQEIKHKTWPFKQDTGQPIQECKNDFWQQYLQNIKQVAHPYDWNLVSCNSPNLIHVSPVYENGIQTQVQDSKWTFLISNPTISHSHLEKTGNHYIDQVSYLDGLYQMVAQKVVLKKVITKNCIS